MNFYALPMAVLFFFYLKCVRVYAIIKSTQIRSRRRNYINEENIHDRT